MEVRLRELIQLKPGKTNDQQVTSVELWELRAHHMVVTCRRPMHKSTSTFHAHQRDAVAAWLDAVTAAEA